MQIGGLVNGTHTYKDPVYNENLLNLSNICTKSVLNDRPYAVQPIRKL